MHQVRISPDERQKDRYLAPSVRYEPKGELELRITGEHGYAVSTWCDGKVRRVEDQLNRIILAMLVAVEQRRRSRERQQREEAVQLQREQERREQERLRQIERARIEQFEDLAGRWQKAEILGSFVEAVRDEAIRRSGGIESGGELARWLEWAARYIRAIDRLSAAKLPALECQERAAAG